MRRRRLGGSVEGRGRSRLDRYYEGRSRRSGRRVGGGEGGG